MISVLIGVLIIVVVGAICFWAIDKFATEAISMLGICDIERPQIGLHARQGPFEKSQCHVSAFIK